MVMEKARSEEDLALGSWVDHKTGQEAKSGVSFLYSCIDIWATLSGIIFLWICCMVIHYFLYWGFNIIP